MEKKTKTSLERVRGKNKEANSQKIFQKEQTLPSDENGRLYWIGIGASAGGLEAIRELVATIPSRSLRPVTYIVAQHLSPKHQSMLVQLVGRTTTLTVRELEDGTIPEPNVMYVTPPNCDVFVKDQVMYLREPSSVYSPKPSVDNFFTSLAEDVGDHAIGVILSGTGSDGSHGVRAIRAAGGLTIAQELQTAKYDGMPQNAISTGCVDRILPPEKILKEIFKLLDSPRSLSWVHENETQQSHLEELLNLLKRKTGVDFKEYKTGTLYRRINRRIAACSQGDLESYLSYCREREGELDLLFKDIMISVTSFFRDPQAFESLEESVSKIIRSKEGGQSIRIWVPGCATGEEAYSIAILFAEACGGIAELTEKFKFQIFATDIDIDALARARRGEYSETTLMDMKPALKKKYFRLKQSSFEILKSVRDTIVFSKHNVCEDPPFLRLDLVACRNLLIYFNNDLQHKVLSLFHYGLSPGGVLFLGKSESMGQSTQLFQSVDNKNKIFQVKLLSSTEANPSQKINYTSTQRVKNPLLTPPNKAVHDLPDAFVEALSPDSILIDEGMNVVRVYGDVQAYTQLSPGGISTNLMSLARQEFRQELRALVYKILRENVSETVLPKKLNIQGKIQEINVILRPMILRSTQERLILVSFERVRISKKPEKNRIKESNDPFVTELEHELAATKEHLQTVVEELETSNEELQATNEEMQSTNEELQSSNEELETANEELQSTNEELLTVNEELQVKTNELTTTNEDLSNIKESIDFPMLVVDKNLRIKQFNTAASKIFLINSSHHGESLTSLATTIDLPGLRKSVLDVIQKEKPFSRQLDVKDVCYYERILPYKDDQNTSQGAVLTYINNTLERNSADQLKKSEERFALAVKGSNTGIWDWDLLTEEMYWSPFMVKTLGINKEKTSFTFKDFEKRIHPDDHADVMSVLEAHFDRDFEFNIEFRMQKGKDTYIWVHVRGQAEWDKSLKPYRMVGALYDITERQKTLDRLTHSNQSLERFAYVCSHDLKEPARIIENFTNLFVAQYGQNIDGEGKNYLKYIQESSQNIQNLIKGILTYSQLANKNATFTMVDCAKEVEKVLEGLKFSIEESGVKVTVDPLPTIYADRMQIFQVFQNLIGNSIKFSQKKKPVVQIYAESRDDEWEFVVKDNGIGMKQEYASKIFNVFQRLNNKDLYPGTGIGLSICQQIVHQHGGRIWVRAQPQKGAAFHFTLPKKKIRRKIKNENTKKYKAS